MTKPLSIFSLMLSLIISSCQPSYTSGDISGSATVTKTPEQLKQELRQTESQTPADYIKFTGKTHRKNLLGETVLEGRVENTATMASFKDIVFEAEFLAPSGTSLGKEQFTRYELLGPRYGVTYKFKTFAPKETSSVAIRVVTAVPTN